MRIRTGLGYSAYNSHGEKLLENSPEIGSNQADGVIYIFISSLLFWMLTFPGARHAPVRRDFGITVLGGLSCSWFSEATWLFAVLPARQCQMSVLRSTFRGGARSWCVGPDIYELYGVCVMCQFTTYMHNDSILKP